MNLYPNTNKGSALFVALFTIALLAAGVAIALNKTAALGTITDRSRDLLEAQLVAEGTVEYGYGIWKKTIQSRDEPLSTSQINAIAPAFAGFDDQVNNGQLKVQATDEYGAPQTSANAKPIPVIESLDSYPGWQGQTSNYVATARVGQTDARGRKVEAGVRRRFQYVKMPLFQMMFYFEHDLEMYKPGAMTLSGLIHTNSNLYLSYGTESGSPSPVTFEGKISYAGEKFIGDGTSNVSPTNTPPPFVNGSSQWNAGEIMYEPVFPDGSSSQIAHVNKTEIIGQAADVINSQNTNPNDDSLHELIEPPSKTIDPATGQVFEDSPAFDSRRLYNQAGIIITINGKTATIEGQNGTTLAVQDTVNISNAFIGKNVIYDQRETKSVETANFDVATLTSALNSISNFNGILYVQDVTAATPESPQPKAIRLQNGGVLPDKGLTVVSQNPVYVQGDYNTGTVVTSGATQQAVPSNKKNAVATASPTVSGYTRKPAAVIGDAVMLLSNYWDDSAAALDVASRKAANTTYNMALVSGFMPSGYQPADGSPAYGYSGGANNYPRFLEDWTNKTCTYYGSMVELFQSTVFTGKWDTGSIYRPPTRRWNFDTNFLTNLPPGSLYTNVFSRGSWLKF